ncbi:MAG: DUF445 domain-containing protein [Bacteroidetes bacterium CG12_big_fil_rev_8_21_14_0_65_60_17]|nr:MAG: DUF445 domain-containing protein [Bacteroidetes bacterium CG12_big_fil_rev_8_21_14_0_65_60_17]
MSEDQTSQDRGLSVGEAREATRSTATELRHLLARHIRRHLPSRVTPRKKVAEPPRLIGGHARLLPLLKIIPWMLAALFVFSFTWDFPGGEISALGMTLPLEGVLRFVSVSGLIGFLTNWVAITMLFNPRGERPILGQGLIPAQRERVVYRLATAVSEELINEEIIKQKIEENNIIPRYRALALDVTRGVLEDDAFRADFKKLTASYLEAVLTSPEVRTRIVQFVIAKIESWAGQGLGGFALKAYRFVNEEDFTGRVEDAIASLPDQLDIVMDEMDALLDVIPGKIEARSEDIEHWATKVVLGFVENLDVYDMVMSNMMAYDDRRLEELIKRSTNEQLSYIKYLGGILGACGGLVIWQPLPALIVFAVVGATVYGADVVIFRLRRA